jgi:uncharacterized protein YjiS (DUF1127 family)
MTRNETLPRLTFPSPRRLIAAFAEHRAARREASRIAAELNSYSDRELLELGLFRHDIPAVAEGTYRR